MPLEFVHVQWADVNAESSFTNYILPDGSTPILAEQVGDTFADLSIAQVTEVAHEVVVQGPTAGAGASGPFDSFRDFVVLRFQTVSGITVGVSANSPKAAIFLGDNLTVDEDQADVAVAIAFAIANLVDNLGSPFAEYVSGNRFAITK